MEKKQRDFFNLFYLKKMGISFSLHFTVVIFHNDELPGEPGSR